MTTVSLFPKQKYPIEIQVFPCDHLVRVLYPSYWKNLKFVDNNKIKGLHAAATEEYYQYESEMAPPSWKKPKFDRENEPESS